MQAVAPPPVQCWPLMCIDAVTQSSRKGGSFFGMEQNADDVNSYAF